MDEDFLNGLSLHRAGQLSEAEQLYRRVLASNPHHADAHYHLGVIALAVNQAAGALPHLKFALQANPNHGHYWLTYITALAEAGHTDAARAMCAQGVAMGLQGVEIDALAMRLGTERPVKQVGVAASKDEIAQLTTLATARRFTDMEALAKKVTLRFPNDGVAWKALGSALIEQRAAAEAIEPLRLAARLLPRDADNLCNLANALERVGEFHEAEICYRHALTLQPEFPLAHSNLLLNMNYAAEQSSAACLAEAQRYGEVGSRAAKKFTSWHCDAATTRLRVGLVSGDFNQHPVGFFLESFLAAIDPAKIELFAYMTSNTSDDLTARIKPRFAAWKSIVDLADADAAKIIHADSVHILVDLAGHTAHNRLPVFAYKPAPVQVTWLGYFATTGVAEIDFLLADEVGVPADHRGQFSEQILYLPDTRLCFSAPANAPPVVPLPALARGHITFGCFQHLPKLNDHVLRTWAKILLYLPTARLRLQLGSLGAGAVHARLAQRLMQHGIALARVSMFEATPRAQYLAAHADVDMILDTFPYPGGTTTCEALWMGVPTLTLAGDRLLSRQGASLLAASGLSDWVAANELDYVRKAVAFASDTAALATLRERLRAQVFNSPVFDARRFAQHWEHAIGEMWNLRR